MTVTVPATSVPQNDQGRQRRDMVDEMVSYVGGTNIAAAKTRAGKSLDRAVRQFNNILWRFNVVEQDVTLVVSTDEYDLTVPFRAPLRAYVLDSNSDRRGLISYYAYPEWLVLSSDDATGTGSTPLAYTVRNVHRESKVIYNPLGTSLRYPTVHHVYYTDVRLASGNTDKLNVPADVEEAIFATALGDFMKKERGPSDAVLYIQEATALREKAEIEWRGWPEIPWVGAE